MLLIGATAFSGRVLPFRSHSLAPLAWQFRPIMKLIGFDEYPAARPGLAEPAAFARSDLDS